MRKRTKKAPPRDARPTTKYEDSVCRTCRWAKCAVIGTPVLRNPYDRLEGDLWKGDPRPEERTLQVTCMNEVIRIITPGRSPASDPWGGPRMVFSCDFYEAAVREPVREVAKAQRPAPSPPGGLFGGVS